MRWAPLAGAHLTYEPCLTRVSMRVTASSRVILPASSSSKTSAMDVGAVTGDASAGVAIGSIVDGTSAAGVSGIVANGTSAGTGRFEGPLKRRAWMLVQR